MRRERQSDPLQAGQQASQENGQPIEEHIRRPGAASGGLRDGRPAAAASWSRRRQPHDGRDPGCEPQLRPCSQTTALSCSCPMQIVSDALRYFGRHFREPIPFTQLASSLGISEDCLSLSFDRIRGMTPAEALQEHRLNRLFTSLSDQPRQGLGLAIRACGLGQTEGVVALFEHTFGIDMPLFLLTCRRAADDRQFRRDHPEAEALVLPT